MRKGCALSVGIMLSVFMVGAVGAAPADTSDKARQQELTSKPKAQGVQNAKKAMQYRLERDKKMRELQKKGQAMKQQLQSGT